jgi:hypothetical protein
MICLPINRVCVSFTLQWIRVITPTILISRGFMFIKNRMLIVIYWKPRERHSGDIQFHNINGNFVKFQILSSQLLRGWIWGRVHVSCISYVRYFWQERELVANLNLYMQAAWMDSKIRVRSTEYWLSRKIVYFVIVYFRLRNVRRY